MDWEEISFKEFHDGPCSGHLGYRNRTILAILNLCVAPMLPIKVLAQSDLTFRMRCHLRNFKVAAILDILTNFSNSESLCQFVAFHQVGLILLTVWEEI